jgi:hypothetical protein
MRKLILVIMLILVPVFVSAQVFINEHFSGTFPPAGWTTDSHPTNWHSGVSNNAGGSAPEAIFDWEPQFSGITRFMSPRVDLTGVTTLKVQFKHMIDHYTTPYTVGVATRHGTSAWNIVWQLNPTGNVGPQVITRDITNADVGTADFQICWFFNGASYNIDYWYFDDILLYSPLAHDVKVASILVNPQYTQGAVITPRASLENFGLNSETFGANFRIMAGQNTLYDQTVSNITLTAGQTSTTIFPNFTIPTANELYKAIVITQLQGDMNASNDTLSTWFNTYTTPRDMVALEIGTGTWCPYCPGAAKGANDLITNHLNVAVVEYHSGGGGDPFINTYGDARVNYYGISGFPTAWFDGILKFVGGDSVVSMYSYYLPLVNQRRAIKSAFSIALLGDHTGNNYQIQVRVTKHAPIPYENMVLHLALTESDIAYIWQGQTHVEWVERLMAPDENGTTLNFSTGDIQTINLNFTLNAAWIVNNCEIAAFIQNLDNKEILQGTKIMLNALPPTAIDDDMVILPTETKLKGNYPNPFNPATKIEYSLKESGNVRLDIYNPLGQKVRTLVDSHVNAGDHSVIWDGLDANGNPAASGAYFFKLTTDKYTSAKKMVLLK